MTFKNNAEAQIDLNSEVPYISFPVLSEIPFLRHGFSTKLGGVSTGFFTSMNLGSESIPYIDDAANIEENYRRIAKSIGFDVHSVVVSLQVHKTKIKLVDENDRGKGLFVSRDYDEIDGLITNKPNITLVTKYADCVPLYFVDTVKKAIGLTHSGWRGTVSKIGKITVEAMNKNFGSNPKDIIAVIGPSICADCYEIGEETAAEFKKAFPKDWEENILIPKGNISEGNISDMSKDNMARGDMINISKGIMSKGDISDMSKGIMSKGDISDMTKGNISKGDCKYLCDLWAANRIVLLEAGLEPGNIHVSGVCTACNSDLLFSHRKTQWRRGSLAAFLCMTE